MSPQYVEALHRTLRKIIKTRGSLTRAKLNGKLPHLVKDRIGDPADEVGRDVGRVEFGKMALNLPHRHAAGVGAQNLVIETGEVRLALAYGGGPFNPAPPARQVQRHD
jgi:hypothetical protein